jgi:hypothetical protein
VFIGNALVNRALPAFKGVSGNIGTVARETKHLSRAANSRNQFGDSEMEFLVILGRGVIAGLGGVVLFEIVQRFAANPRITARLRR